MTNLKSLLEQLKPEIRTVIESERSLYPNSIRHLCQNLSEVYFVSDMRYEDAEKIMSYHGVAFGRRAENPWECISRPVLLETE